MDRELILQKFKTLNLWQKGGKRAPHKPLLVLYAIGKLLRAESRLTAYSDIEEKLGKLLQEFGPWESSNRPEFPFWRLRNDGVWEVSDEDKIKQTESGDAYITDLRRYKVSGGFPEPIAPGQSHYKPLFFYGLGQGNRIINPYFSMGLASTC